MTERVRFLPGLVSCCISALVICAPPAHGDEATARAMIAKWAGNYDTDAFLKEPAVSGELRKLLGSEMGHLLRNLDVRGAVDLSSETLSINGNAPHQIGRASCRERV